MHELVSLISGGALVGVILTFVQFLISRKDAKESEENRILKAIGELSDKIGSVEDRIDRNSADEARRNILLFDDELRRHEPHSEESYNQVIEDADHYQHYCSDHPEYENNKAANAIKHINETYQQVKAEDRFI